MNQQTQNKEQIGIRKHTKPRINPEYKDKPIQTTQDGQKVQSKDKSCGDDVTNK